MRALARQVVGTSTEYFQKQYSPSKAYLCSTASLFAGMGVMAVVDTLVHRVFDAISGEHADHRADIEESGVAMVSMCPSDAPAEENFDDESGASIRAVARIAERQKLLMMAAVVSTTLKSSHLVWLLRMAKMEPLGNSSLRHTSAG